MAPGVLPANNNFPWAIPWRSPTRFRAGSRVLFFGFGDRQAKKTQASRLGSLLYQIQSNQLI
ncbi:hypothetical protein [Planktothricoides raciborskii]|uniref:Uncharacterized protein n=1 Tax=Planktothricoides raciborskii GIHE-MW2 TaxID=2792601 RepID=A0AAU8JLZ3_9CYAN|nr:hypothetical protein AM228_19410 [Planktothricoides sp. SR001]